MTGALRILGKATYVWNYRQCIVLNTGLWYRTLGRYLLAPHKDQSQLLPDPLNHIQGLTSTGLPKALPWGSSSTSVAAVPASSVSVGGTAEFLRRCLNLVGILYFCPPRCLGPDLNLGASQGESRTLISTSLHNYLFPYLLSCSRVFLVPTPRYSLHNML